MSCELKTFSGESATWLVLAAFVGRLFGFLLGQAPIVAAKDFLVSLRKATFTSLQNAIAQVRRKIAKLLRLAAGGLQLADASRSTDKPGLIQRLARLLP
jgi:hypothetical protein